MISANQTIWKYALEVTDIQTINLPRNSKFLAAMTQYDIPTLWFEVDSSRFTEERQVAIVGTGHAIPDGFDLYLDSVMQGPFVWHIYLKV